MNKFKDKQLKVAAAQLSEIPKEYFGGVDAYMAFKKIKASDYDSYISSIDIEAIRKFNIGRMMDLIQTASKDGIKLIVFPELSLTGFFPYLYIKNEKLLNKFFEDKESLNKTVQTFSELSKKNKIAISFGFAELTNHSRRYNTAVYISPEGQKEYYRKTHIPGFETPDEAGVLFQFEKGIFSSSRQGYPVFETRFNNRDAKVGMIICHDRRYNAPYLSMGLKKVNIILNGYNTPFNLSFADALDSYVYKFHYLPLQSQAVSEGTFIISVARAGNSYGVKQIAGSCVISPYGEILNKSETLKEELVVSDIDLKQCDEVKAQKYWGTQSKPEVLMTDLISNKIGINEVMDKLYDTLGYENLVSYFDQKLHEESYENTWQEESMGAFSIFSQLAVNE